MGIPRRQGGIWRNSAEISEELGIVLDEGDLTPAGFAETGVGEGGAPLVLMLYTARRWSGDPRALEGGAIDWFTPVQASLLDRPPLDRYLCARLFAEEEKGTGKEGCQG